MTQQAILLTPESAPELWLARAEQARRIALMLSPTHAAVLVAYASECEAAALAHMDAHEAPIAA
jgi:hypothetical protein